MKVWKNIFIIFGGVATGLLVGFVAINVSNLNFSQLQLGSREEPDDFVDTSIPASGKVIAVNLTTKKLSLFEDGQLRNEYSILSKNDSETTEKISTGKYEIEIKKENVFSDTNGVWLPWFMRFSENFFISGWPYLPDGTPVENKFVDEGIRLATADAKEVFTFAYQGITIVVQDEDETSKNIEFGNSKYEFKRNYMPVLSSRAFVVGDLETGEIIMKKNADSVYPIASLSKLMTAMISLETINQFKEIVINKKVLSTYGSQGHLAAGERFEVGDLIYPLILESSNDAAEALANFAGREVFISNMNAKAGSIGLKKTSFEDPSGLSVRNVSTADDLFNLSKYIYNFKTIILDISRLKVFTEDGVTWHNIGKFVGDKNFIGGKSGYTDEARQTLITLYKLPLAESGNRHLAIVILQSGNAYSDTKRIISYLRSNVVYKE